MEQNPNLNRSDQRYLNRIRGLERRLREGQVTIWIDMAKLLEAWEITEPHTRRNLPDFASFMSTERLVMRPVTYMTLKALLRTFGEERVRQVGVDVVRALNAISPDDPRWDSTVAQVVSRTTVFIAENNRSPSFSAVRQWIREIVPDQISTRSRTNRDQALAKAQARIRELEAENAELLRLNLKLNDECRNLRRQASQQVGATSWPPKPPKARGQKRGWTPTHAVRPRAVRP
jgi:hypothetical protein